MSAAISTRRTHKHDKEKGSRSDEGKRESRDYRKQKEDQSEIGKGTGRAQRTCKNQTKKGTRLMA